jgi:hypothetical protein
MKSFFASIEPNEIVQIYGNIVFTMEQLYPDHKWESWRWSKIPDGYWDDMRRQREYFDWLFTHLKLKVFEDWYNVSYKDIRRSPGTLSKQELPPTYGVLS